jgi:hypothetical protein
MSKQSLTELNEAKEILTRLLRGLESTRDLARRPRQKDLLEAKVHVALQELRDLEIAIEARKAKITP